MSNETRQLHKKGADLKLKLDVEETSSANCKKVRTLKFPQADQDSFGAWDALMKIKISWILWKSKIIKNLKLPIRFWNSMRKDETGFWNLHLVLGCWNHNQDSSHVLSKKNCYLCDLLEFFKFVGLCTVHLECFFSNLKCLNNFLTLKFQIF